jgi:hypothetical protein
MAVARGGPSRKLRGTRGEAAAVVGSPREDRGNADGRDGDPERGGEDARAESRGVHDDERGERRDAGLSAEPPSGCGPPKVGEPPAPSATGAAAATASAWARAAVKNVPKKQTTVVVAVAPPRLLKFVSVMVRQS